MGEETLVGEVSESEAAAPTVETKPVKNGDSLTQKMEVESNGVKDLQDDGKDLVNEKTDAGKEVKEDKDCEDSKGEEEPKAEATDVGAIKEENRVGVVGEKEYEEKAEKDVDVNGVKDEKDAKHEEKTEERVEKSGEEKIEEQLGEGSKEEDTAEEVERSKKEKNVEEVEESKEVKNAGKLEDAEEVKDPDELEESKEEKNADKLEDAEEVKDLDELEESKEEKNADEAEDGQEEKIEEEHDEGKLPNSKEGKVSKKRSRRKSFGVRRDRKKKEGKEVEEEEAAKREKVSDTKKNKKEEEKKVKDEKELDRTPILVDRPVRERKSVERLVSVIEKDAHKEFKIEKGCGTPLKDIPNVASKLRRKNDDTLKLLHNCLFGQRCKAFEIRGHISRFSGFVWHDDEEKKKNKVKEKFDKCNKEKLLEICDVLDIQVSRASIKKEDLVTTLIDFLVAPHATTTVVLAEKESSKGQKRKRALKQSSPGSAKRSGKSQKKSEDSSKGKSRRRQSDSDNDSEEEEEEEPEIEVETENGIPEKSDDEMADQSESEEEDVSEESGDETRKRKSKAKSSGKKKAVTVQKPKKPSSSRSKVDDGDKRVSSKKNEKGIKKSPTPTKSGGKKDTKGKGKPKMKPSDEVLRNAICEIFKDVDFNTATFTDILKQLAKQFVMDLTSRKSSIKLMIQEELTKLADEADDDEEEDGEGEPEKEEGDAGKDEVVTVDTEVKA